MLQPSISSSQPNLGRGPTSVSARFHPRESESMAVVKIACFVKSSRTVSRKTDAKPPNAFEMGVVSMKPCGFMSLSFPASIPRYVEHVC